jgi:hypothetical protein
MPDEALLELRLLLTRLAPRVTSSRVHDDPRLEAARSALECAYLLTVDVGDDGGARSPHRLDDLRAALGAARAAVVAASWAVRAAHDRQL